MSKVTFNVNEKDDLTVVEFELESGVVAPEDLPAAVEAAPEVNAEKGVVVSGRGPVWLYAALVHEYHPTRWVGTFDPRLGGGIVVERHHEDAPELGTVVPV